MPRDFLAVDRLLPLPDFFLLVPRVALLADFFFAAAFFPDFLLAAFLEPLEPDFLLAPLRAFLVAICITPYWSLLSGYLQKQRLPIAEEALLVVDH
jgi:hypothetical protein